jgi:hypothetical protein
MLANFLLRYEERLRKATAAEGQRSKGGCELACLDGAGLQVTTKRTVTEIEGEAPREDPKVALFSVFPH